MLSLIIAPSGYGKTDNIVGKIKNILSSSQNKKIYVIVPEQESVKMEARLLRECGNIVNKMIEVLNFSRLANRVFREAGGMTYKYIDNCGKDLITAVIIEKMKKEIPTFASSSDDTKYIQLIREEMDSMRQKGIRPKDFEKARESFNLGDKGGESFDKKLSDFSLLFSTYEEALREGNTDSADDVFRLAETLKEFDFFEDSYVFIDGFYDYTLPQYLVIEQIIKSAVNTTVTFSLSLADPDEIFRKTRLAYDTIRELAEKNYVEYEKIELNTNVRTKSPEIARIAENIMNGTEGLMENATDNVDITAVLTPYDECVYVAHEITKLVKSGTRFSNIAVTTSSVSEYGSMLENVFDAYEIKYLSCTERSPITHPIVTLVLSALDTVNSNFFYKHIKTYLKSEYLNLSDEECYLLENYITVWKMKYKLWQDDKAWTMHPRGYVEAFTSADEKELEIVNKAREKAYQPLKRLKESMEDKSVENKVRGIIAFLDELCVYDKIDEDDEEEKSAWNMLLQALDNIVNGAGELKISKERFVKYLRLVLSDMSFGKIPSSLDEVEIGEVGFVRNKNIKHMFFIGFNDGAFPRLSETRSVFTERERKWLQESDICIEDSIDDKIHDQLFLFLLAVLTPSEALHFVYHTTSSDSAKAKALPSYFYSYIKDSLGCEIKHFNLSEERPVNEKELEAYFLSSANDDRLSLIENNYSEFSKRIKHLKDFLQIKDKIFHIDDARSFIKNNYAMTQSRLERFEKCRFSYFIEYMLKARARKEAHFGNAEIGSYVHKILELVLKKLTSEGEGIEKTTPEEIIAISEKTASEYIVSVAPDINSDSPKYKYLVDNISSFVVFVIENIRSEFSASLFRPKLFEENLGDSKEVKPYEVKLRDGGTLYFYGVIDRVDTYVDENGIEYIRVVDYKTKSGGKSFSLEDVINGMNLQMLIYLFAMTSTPAENERRAAGIMYMPAGKPDFKPSDNEVDDVALRNDIDTGLMRSGMYLDDKKIIDAMESGENKRFIDLKYDKKTGTYSNTASSTLIQLEAFGLIEKYVNFLFDSVMTSLKEGDITPEPLEDGTGKSSCDWCSYKAICRFEGEGRKRIKEKNPIEYMKNAIE